MMVFFLVFPFLALFLAMLCAAALTFTATAAIPAFRSSAITAPIIAFIISPALIFPLSIPIYAHVFIINPPIGSAAFWVRFGTVIVLLSAGCIFIAYVAVLVCRAIFQLVPPWLANSFGVRANLLLQASILVGGSLSILVLLTTASLLIYFLKNNSIMVLLCGIGGLITATICIRSFLRLTEPECYQPKPLSGWASKLLLARR
jgi:hypothetical protein